MSSVALTFWLRLWAILTLAGELSAVALAQADPFGPSRQFELDSTVQVETADNTVVTNLERVRAYVKNEQWRDAIAILRELLENAGGSLLPVTATRYVGVREYVQLELARLPPEALALYRGQVDALAESWYQAAVEGRDAALLDRVVERALLSSRGDDALWVLGEWALEGGDYAMARDYWERILPVEAPPGTAVTTLAYPDTDLDRAAVRARLVLTTILEGDLPRASAELARLAQLHPDAEGRLGGRKVRYATFLGTLLEEAAGWPPLPDSPDWPTFAGAVDRNRLAPRPLIAAGLAWRTPIDPLGILMSGLDEPTPAVTRAPRPAGASRTDDEPNYFPVAVGKFVLLSDAARVFALELATGRPAWNDDGVIYRDEMFLPLAGRVGQAGVLGRAHATLTVHESRLYARMGPPVTSQPQGLSGSRPTGHLVCLDLASQGRLLWRSAPEEGWAFEGAPVCDEAFVYIAMRRSDVRPQVHVACLDARTGALRWRRFVASAETASQGLLAEITHNLLTLQRDTIYFNTNLGAVAAISTSGNLRWVSLYPRARTAGAHRAAAHWRRDVSPCVAHRGRIYVAPADSPAIFALDAATGQMLWKTAEETADVLHLLGASDQHVIATGARLYWIGLDDGRVQRSFPDSQQALGYGRGLLTADAVYWPSRDRIHVFDLRTAQPRRIIELRPVGAMGGNLLVAQGRLLVAAPRELFGWGGGAPSSLRVEAPRN